MMGVSGHQELRKVSSLLSQTPIPMQQGLLHAEPTRQLDLDKAISPKQAYYQPMLKGAQGHLPHIGTYQSGMAGKSNV